MESGFAQQGSRLVRLVALQVMISRVSVSRAQNTFVARARLTTLRFSKAFTRLCESAINIWALFIDV